MVFARIRYDSDAYEDYVKSNNWIRGTMFPSVQKEFFEYYNSKFVGKTKKTYNDYLPIYVSGEGDSKGNLIINWDKIDFIPREENEDLFLVYRIAKLRGATLISAPHIPELFSGIAWTEDDVIEYESYRSFILTTSDELTKIGCDKFLTVPA